MRSRSIAYCTALIGVLLSPTIALAGFPDVPPTHPHVTAITFLSSVGVLNGYPDGTFQPEKAVNRAEALKIIFANSQKKLEEQVTSAPFKDVPMKEWFTPYVAHARKMGIVNGNPDGTFTPARTVKRAEFLKMLLEAYSFQKEKWVGKSTYSDIPRNTWFEPYMTYGAYAGLLVPDGRGNLYPEKTLSRGEVAEILYIMSIILNGKNTQFLLNRAQAEISQIDIYIGAGQAAAAKKSSELAVDLTQKALSNMSDNATVLGAAKIARAYDAIVDALLSFLAKKPAETKKHIEIAILKADEAYQADKNTEALSEHIKKRAGEIGGQP